MQIGKKTLRVRLDQRSERFFRGNIDLQPVVVETEMNPTAAAQETKIIFVFAVTVLLVMQFDLHQVRELFGLG